MERVAGIGWCQLYFSPVHKILAELVGMHRFVRSMVVRSFLVAKLQANAAEEGDNAEWSSHVHEMCWEQYLLR